MAHIFKEIAYTRFRKTQGLLPRNLSQRGPLAPLSFGPRLNENFPGSSKEDKLFKSPQRHFFGAIPTRFSSFFQQGPLTPGAAFSYREPQRFDLHFLHSDPQLFKRARRVFKTTVWFGSLFPRFYRPARPSILFFRGHSQFKTRGRLHAFSAPKFL